MFSGVFVSSRNPDSLRAQDLHAVSFSSQSIDTANQSVSANVFGLSPAKAIYRKGLGCTLVNELLEEQIRAQPSIPASSAIDVVALEPAQNPDLQAVINSYFADSDPEKAINTRAIVVMQNGKILSEKYAAGYTAQTPLLGWSMTKSVTNAMIGLLVQDGKLEVEKSANFEYQISFSSCVVAFAPSLRTWVGTPSSRV